MKVTRDAETPAAPADAQQFAGQVTRKTFISADDSDGMSGLRFDYAPGAHSHWHIHEQEQAIVAVEGRGLVAWEGRDAPIELAPGDWWHVSAGVRHWHGATPDEPFSHLAINAGGGTTWVGEVTPEEYAAGRD